MKKLFIIFFLLISIHTFGQLNGRVKVKKLKTEAPYSVWFTSEYNAYELDKDIVLKIKPLLKDIKIKVFFGSWCSDSKNHLPDFVKIIEKADYKVRKLEFIGVDKEKSTKKGYEKGKNITHVPTFIFYGRDNQEIGRIVENPNSTLETDIFNILDR